MVEKCFPKTTKSVRICEVSVFASEKERIQLRCAIAMRFSKERGPAQVYREGKRQPKAPVKMTFLQ